MKIKVSEATPPQINWLVAKCEGLSDGAASVALYNHCGTGLPYTPSTKWSQAGLIIDREGIGIYKLNGAWSAHCPVKGSIHACMDGQPTALIAAMRSYVASKLGDEVDVPDELI